MTIPHAERDLELSEKLKAEWPGTLAWMIEGCSEWQTRSLQPPDAVRAATADYLAAEDALSEWIDECCDRIPTAWTSISELFASWTAWATKAGELVRSQKWFINALEGKGFEARRERNRRGFRGLSATYAT